jgi:amino-acid N-acetyltransferase
MPVIVDTAPPARLESPLRARTALPADAFAIAALIAQFTADGSLLPRSVADVLSCIESYVVVSGLHGDVLACAALFEYSPSLAEVGSVAVARSAQGHGLGTVVVRAVERLARMRGHRELFAISLADHFFGHLGYRAATLDQYPEKIARYALIVSNGTALIPKRCFRRRLRAPRMFPRVAKHTALASLPTVYHAQALALTGRPPVVARDHRQSPAKQR